MVFNVKSKGAIIHRLCYQTFDYDHMCETRGKPNGNLLMKGSTLNKQSHRSIGSLQLRSRNYNYVKSII